MANDFSTDDNCVALWKFENGMLTTDSKGGNTLSSFGSPTSNTSDYKEGTGCVDLELNTPDYYSITDANLDAGFPLKSGDTDKKISVCCWFKLETIAEGRFYCPWSKYDSTTNKRSIMPVVVEGPPDYLVVYQGYNNGNNAEGKTLTHDLTTGVWYHFGFTYDNSDKSYRIRLYDTSDTTVYETTGNYTNSINVEDASWVIGGVPNVLNWWDGLIDEIVVFKDILTSGEIDAIRGGIYPGPPHWAKILTANPVGLAVDDYCKLTANDVIGRSYVEVKADLDLEIGTDVLAYDAGLQNLADVVMAADKFYYTSADNVHVAATVTAAGRAILDDANAAAQATTLGLGTGDSPQFTGIELGHASDTTFTRVSAGVVAIEGTNIAMSGGAFHDGFSDFVANEHIDHTGVSITAGKGLSGGGDISSTRSLALDLTEMTGNVTWDDGSTDASITWTYALSGANDPVWTVGSNSMDLTTGALKQGGTQVLLVGDAPTAHTHDGDTLQLDGINSDGGAFGFTTTGLVTFNQSIAAANYAAANKLTACATNAGALDFSAASKTLTVEDSAVVSQDYSSDASPQFTGIELGHVSDTTVTRASAGNLNVEGNLIYRAGGTDVPITDGGSGQSTAQAAIDALSAVAGGGNEEVLTKDTGTGNAVWKASGGGVHTHDGDTLQLDAVNSNGGAFAFSTTGTVTFNQTVVATALDAGTDDTTRGIISAYGPATGNDYGGTFSLYTAFDHAGDVNNYYLRTHEDNLQLGDSTNGPDMTILGTDGRINIHAALFIDERAAAFADVAGKGQIWVKTVTPNELWFTDDGGTDVKLGGGGAHTHDGNTLQLDGVNSNGGAFNFNTTGQVTFNQTVGVGANDVTRGILETYGAGTGNDYGGTISLFTCADHDTTVNNYYLRTYEDDLQIGDSNNGANITILGTDGRINIHSSLFINERAAGYGNVAAKGQVWVKNDAPNTLWFQDDAGTDFQLGAGANHAILDGSVHSDSVADSVTRGSIIYGNATPKWDELVIGAADTFLGSDGTDVSYRTATQVLASLSAEAGTAFDLNGQDLTNGGVLYLTEQAAAEADVAGKGQFWVLTATPNKPYFTDDTGNDSPLDGFVDRGNLAANDFDEGDLTTDNTWNDLDLSGILPAGAKSVYIRVLILDDAANSYLFFKNKDYADDVNSVGMYTPAANIGVINTYQVTVDSNRKIQYLGSNLVFTTINIAVVGWWF